jgi:crotonobetainyl-CoA:carnitine CoA-transferase CaiB-like acyl-CoA transferase
VAAGSDGLFRRLAGVLGHPEWADDPRFVSNPARVEHQHALYALIEAEMLGRGTAEWTALLDEAGVPCAPVQNVQQMLTHPQTEALGIVQHVPDSRLTLVGLPMSIDGERPPSAQCAARARRRYRRSLRPASRTGLTCDATARLRHALHPDGRAARARRDPESSRGAQCVEHADGP